MFKGDSGSTWVNAGAGDDVIVAGNGADRIQPGEGADYVHGGLNNNSGGGGNASWFRDEANFWEAPYARTEVNQVKVMVSADTGLMTHTSDDQFIIYNYTGQAARVEDYEEDVSINESVKTFNSSTIIVTGADVDAISNGDNLSGSGNLTLDGTGSLGTGKYISISGSGDNSGVKFTVTGTDNVNTPTTSSTVTINILNANDNAPVFTSSNTFTAAENQTAIGTVTATDGDGNLNPLTYSISGNEISIDSTSGVLTFNSAPDYETKSTYTATVKRRKRVRTDRKMRMFLK